ncbi:hypothetical protein SAMN05216387_11035 [Nitrosovibrio tenuis]|uniref:Uncharacterized protein n=1 Tax=Nitrosovibrio tenuis TaxID=1233 RepID=A0A1H7PXA2_9PROT|nr:hypothetical protein SAMN05216387_11035 [Nitrosovibrio tenuis]
MGAIAYSILELALIRFQAKDSQLAKAVGQDFKGKTSLVSINQTKGNSSGLVFFCNRARYYIQVGSRLPYGSFCIGQSLQPGLNVSFSLFGQCDKARDCPGGIRRNSVL